MSVRNACNMTSARSSPSTRFDAAAFTFADKHTFHHRNRFIVDRFLVKGHHGVHGDGWFEQGDRINPSSCSSRKAHASDGQFSRSDQRCTRASLRPRSKTSTTRGLLLFRGRVKEKATGRLPDLPSLSHVAASTSVVNGARDCLVVVLHFNVRLCRQQNHIVTATHNLRLGI